MQVLPASADGQGQVSLAIQPGQAAQTQPVQLPLVPIGLHSYQA